MRRKMWIWFLVFFFGLGLKIAWAEWYPGIIHAHSTFSDGDRSPKLLVNRTKGVGEFARKAGRPCFLIVTDHYEQIDNFDNYQDRFSKLASPDFVIIAGAEITTYWSINANSHLLAIGNMESWGQEIFQEISKLQMRKDKETQQELIKFLSSKGLLSVAAHPNLVTLAQFYRPWEIGNFQFDPGNVKELSGIEFFNDGSEGYPRTLNFYLTQLRLGNTLFVTSGCDSHIVAELGDDDRWKRKTWVFSEKLEVKSLLEAMAAGHTYAANYGASFEKLNHIPGFQVQEVDRARFAFGVVFERKTSNRKTVRIYRDGDLVPESVQTLPEYPKGMTKLEKKLFKFDRIDYAWEDKGVEVGEHSYVIEVEGVLITSPIRLKIKTQPPPTAGTAVIEGKYYSRDYPEYYLELKREKKYSERFQRPVMRRTSTWRNGFLLPPEEGEWILEKDKIYVSTKRASFLLTWVEFLIKGNGVIEGGQQSFGGPVWIKEGLGRSFSQEEVSGTYKCRKIVTIHPAEGPDVLVLRPDGTCTYTRAIMTTTESINGTWKIEVDRILAEFDERLPLLAVLDGGRKMVLRVLDRNTLIQQGGKWISETKKVNRTYDYKTASALKQFSLASDFGAREGLTFEVAVPGTITLEATWTSKVETVNLALILNGPGQVSYYVREDGPSPLQAEYTLYTLTAQDVAKSESWAASIVNFSERGPVSGTLKVIYPAQN